MPPRAPLRTPTVIRRYVEAPTEGPAAEALIANPQAVLDSLMRAEPPRVPMPPMPLRMDPPAPISLPASVRAEAARALEAQTEGGRYAFRGERPIRMTVDLPKGLHQALRLQCVKEGRDARAIIIRALASVGIVEP